MKALKLAFIIFVLIVGSNVLFAQQFQSGNYSFSASMQNYTLDKGSGERSMTIEVNFEKGFDKKPQVILSVTFLDSDTQSNTRFNVQAISVSRDGFTIKVTTWSDTKIAGIAGNWLAIAQ